jgi:hypothetical protein
MASSNRHTLVPNQSNGNVEEDEKFSFQVPDLIDLPSSDSSVGVLMMWVL